MNLNTFFKLDALDTSLRAEAVAGLTTFLTMSYIIFVNPTILGTTGMDQSAVFVATCLAAAIGCLVMGLLANWPIGLAPGMGLNAFFAFTVVKGMGFSWQQALGAVFVSGCVFILLTVTGVRKWLVAGIPHALRSAIAAGIGMFLAIIALSNTGVVVASPATKVTLGDLHTAPVALSALGFFLIVVLDYFRVRGAILIGILAVTLASIALGLSEFKGVMSLPPSLAPTWFQLDLSGVLHAGFLQVILAMVLVEIFDATGTLTGVARKAGLLPDARGLYRGGSTATPPNGGEAGLGRALFADSLAIFSGSLLGTSSTTAFVESAAGVQAGGRTGITAIVVGLLFLAALFFAPLAATVPAYATAPALLYVAVLMMRELTEIDWNDLTECVPAGIGALIMPLTYSIANGLGFAFIAYSILKLCTGRAREVHPALWLVAGLFLARYAFFGGQ